MTPLCSSEVFLVKFHVAPTSASKKVERNLVTSVLDHQFLVPQPHNLDSDQPKVFVNMSGKGRCVDKRRAHRCVPIALPKVNSAGGDAGMQILRQGE